MTKMIKHSYYCLLLLISFCCANLFAENLQYENQVIEKIDIEMENLAPGTTFDPETVKARIKTHQGEFFSHTDFDNDLKTLVNEYDHVEPTINSVNDRIYITLKIRPKPTIRMINWDGNKHIASSKLQKELGVSTCTVFDRQAFNRAFHKLKTFYVKKGYFEASLDYNVELDPDTNTVDIQVSICEGRAGRIQDIVFINFEPEEEDELCDDLVTKKYFLLTSWYTDAGTYNEDAIQQDRFTVLSYLQNKGYADATVDIDVVEARQSNRIIINIIAQRGDPYNFGDISFEGSTLFCDEEIQRQFTFDSGDPYSPEDLRDTVRRIQDFYGRRGYIDAVVDYEPRLDCDTLTYSVHFTIEEGEQFRVGLIKVFGNCSTQTRVILHETLVVPGEIFNTIKLQLTEERLKNIGYFKNVNVYAVRSEGPGGLGGHYRDVHVEVEETVTGSFGAGFGVSSVESVFGEFRITERNFNHEGLGCVFQDGLKVLRGGGEFVNLNAMIGAKSTKYSFSWTKPFFRDTPWVVGFEIESSSNRYISNDYDIDANGITFHGAYPFNQFTRLGLHYRLFNTYIKLHHHDKANFSCKLREEARNAGLISAIGLTLSYDSTVSNPRKGLRSRLEQELAGFWGDQTFMSLGYINSYFIPVRTHGVIRLRADMRFIVPLFDTHRQDIPINERLFLGGDNSIRGYRYYRLGPQYNTGDPRGGMSMQLLSAEYTRTFNNRLSAFIFCDSGHLSFDVWNFGTMWTSVGFGFNIRVLDSAPPVVVGLGFPLNPDHHSDVKKFFFNIGGRF